MHKIVAFLARYTLMLLLLGAGVAILLPPWQDYGLLFVLLALLFNGLVQKQPWASTPVTLSVGLFLLSSLLAWHLSPELLSARLTVGRLWAGVGLGYGLMLWAKTPRHLSLLAWFSTLGALLLVAAGGFLVQWPGKKLPFIPHSFYTSLPVKAQGLFNANMLAGALVVLLPLPVAAFLWARGRWRWLARLGYALVSGLMLIVLALTQSRGAWLAGLAALGLLLVARWPRLVWALWPVILVAGWYVYTVGLDQVLQAPLADTMVSGWRSRVELWRCALAMLRDFPLTGPGPGQFDAFLWNLYPPVTVSQDASPYLHAHNMFLQMGVDLGVPGLLAFISLLLSSVIWVIPALREPDLQAAAWGGLAALLALVVHGAVDAPWLVGRAAFALWWAWGIVLSAGRLAAIRQQGRSPSRKRADQVNLISPRDFHTLNKAS